MFLALSGLNGRHARCLEVGEGALLKLGDYASVRIWREVRLMCEEGVSLVIGASHSMRLTSFKRKD